jgi:hypothetical protein
MAKDLRGRGFLAVTDLSQPETLGLLETASWLKRGLALGARRARRSVATILLRVNNGSRVCFKSEVHRFRGPPDGPVRPGDGHEPPRGGFCQVASSVLAQSAPLLAVFRPVDQGP